MIYAVIDVGSNSVRLMLNDGVNTLSKFVKTTRLAEGMGEERELKTVAIDRTVAAVSFFVGEAKKAGAKEVLIFATAAVRRATNANDFTGKIKDTCGVVVDVISGQTEAELGLIGALCGKDGAIIDVGGASTEITVVKNGKTIYSKSLDLGAVTVTDWCGQDKNAVERLVLQKIEEYGEIPKSEFFGIGGTATSLAAVLQELEPYDPTKTHGYILEIEQVGLLVDKLFNMTVFERENLKGLQPSRAKVIASGAAIIFWIMKKAKIDKITVSESDNLEGYLKQKLEKR